MDSEKSFVYVVWGLFMVIGISLGGFCFDYVLGFWSTIAGHPLDVPWYLDAIAGLFLSQFMIPAAIVTLIISCAL